MQTGEFTQGQCRMIREEDQRQNLDITNIQATGYGRLWGKSQSGVLEAKGERTTKKKGVVKKV